METHVYISNISEDVWSFIDSMSPQDKAREIAENAALSDRDLFTLSPRTHTLCILPRALEPEFERYFRSLFPNTSFEVLAPQRHTGQTCLDAMNDPQVWQKIVALGKKQTLTVTSYAYSAPFTQLVTSLQSLGITVQTPESPEPIHGWTVDFFGSKSGIRQTAGQLFPMAEGYIPAHWEAAVSLATDFYQRNRGIVLKTNKAHAGAGVLLIREGEAPAEYETCRQYFHNIFSGQTYWQKFPFVIEALKELHTIAGGNPNAEFFIDTHGSVKFLYSCGMRVSAQGIFEGIEIHQRTLPASIQQPLLKIGQALGQLYARNGYRGYFDVDCIYTSQRKLLVAESNVRRTGGTHVYHAARNLVGRNFPKTHCLLSHNTFPLSQSVGSFAQLVARTQSLTFSPKSQTGVVLAAAHPLEHNMLSYIVFGKTRQEAKALEEKLHKILKTPWKDSTPNQTE